MTPAEVGDTIARGALPAALGVAFAGGVVSFASPCVLPLVPGFLGYITGLTPADAEQAGARRRLTVGALLFVLGFTLVFLLLSVVVSAAGAALAEHRGLLLRAGGVLVIAFGLLFAGAAGGRGWQVRARPAAGLTGAPLLGAAFGLGMSACVGPVLGAILTLSSTLSGDADLVRRGTLLGFAYSLGMGLPFVLLAAGWGRVGTASRWLRDRHRVVQLVGGSLMVVVGALMAAGLWEGLTTWLQREITATWVPVI